MACMSFGNDCFDCEQTGLELCYQDEQFLDQSEAIDFQESEAFLEEMDDSY